MKIDSVMFWKDPFAIRASASSETCGKWHHIAVTHDEKTRTLKLYMDGAEMVAYRIPTLWERFKHEVVMRWFRIRDLLFGRHEEVENE